MVVYDPILGTLRESSGGIGSELVYDPMLGRLRAADLEDTGIVYDAILGRVRQGSLPLTQSTPIYRITDTKARVANKNISYNGTVRMVGVGQTYATITAAYAAAANGDILQLVDGTYYLDAETGGYLMFNTGTKGVLVRGNAADRNAVVLVHRANAYGVRLRDCAEITFENVTLTGSLNYFMSMDPNYSSRFVKFKNCVLTHTGTAGCMFSRNSLTANTNEVWIEFDGCTITSNTNWTPVIFTNSGLNETILFTNTTIAGGNAITVDFNSSHKGHFVMYDCSVAAAANVTVFKFGEDETVPTNSTFTIDFRNNVISFADTFYGHAVLFGRGVTKFYAINNTVTMQAIDNSLALGYVLKATAATLNGDCYFAGNKATCARPFYMKGGQKTVVRYNTFIASVPGWAALETNNPAADRLTTGNHLNNNTILGQSHAMRSYATASVEDADISMATWEADENRYFATSGLWARRATGVEYSFAQKATYWNSDNDAYSTILTSTTLGAETPVTDSFVLP